MKKIAAALGLIQAATEAQILEAIAKQSNDLEALKDTNAQVSKELAECKAHIDATKEHGAQQLKTIEDLKADNDAKALELKEATEQLAASLQKNPNELTEEEAIAKATETLTEAGIAVGYPTSDGTVFTNKDEANTYAIANRLKTLEVIKTK
jgi:ABC-type transporter Mla subunit MlaD